MRYNNRSVLCQCQYFPVPVSLATLCCLSVLGMLSSEPVQKLDVMQFPIEDVDKCGNTAFKVKQGMQFDGAFGGAEASPGKDGQAQVPEQQQTGLNAPTITK